MKAIDLLDLYRKGLLFDYLTIEIRIGDKTEVIAFSDKKYLTENELLQCEVESWFISPSGTPSDIVIELKDSDVK